MHFSAKRETTAVLQYHDAAAGEGEEAAAAGETKTCLDTTLISRRVTHARTQRKHKHETRFPGWRCRKGLTHPTSDESWWKWILQTSRTFLNQSFWNQTGGKPKKQNQLFRTKKKRQLLQTAKSSNRCRFWRVTIDLKLSMRRIDRCKIIDRRKRPLLKIHRSKSVKSQTLRHCFKHLTTTFKKY